MIGPINKTHLMKKFVVLYHAPAKLVASMSQVSPEEAKKGMEGWMKWAAKCGSQLVDMGAPLMGGVRLNPDGSADASKKQVTGYSILEAKSMAGAKSLLKGHPHLKWDGSCSIEVHEAMPLSGM